MTNTTNQNFDDIAIPEFLKRHENEPQQPWRRLFTSAQDTPVNKNLENTPINEAMAKMYPGITVGTSQDTPVEKASLSAPRRAKTRVRSSANASPTSVASSDTGTSQTRVPGDVITISDIARRLNIEPKDARSALRASHIKKPSIGRWCWEQSDEDSIKKVKEFLLSVKP